MVFVKLRPDKRRIENDMHETARRWSSYMSSGGATDTIYVIDKDTMLLHVLDSDNFLEWKKFLFEQEEPYEMQLKQLKVRREGDDVEWADLPEIAAELDNLKSDREAEKERLKKLARDQLKAAEGAKSDL